MRKLAHTKGQNGTLDLPKTGQFETVVSVAGVQVTVRGAVVSEVADLELPNSVRPSCHSAVTNA